MRARPAPSLHHTCAAVLLTVVGVLLAALARPVSAASPFAEFEAAGARIGRVVIRNDDIFDLTDPEEDKALFRLANALHTRTRANVIRSALLFRSGEPVSVSRIEETERRLRQRRYLHDVQIRPLRAEPGMVDIEVHTRDAWSLDPGFSASRQGGANSGGVRLSEYNLLGSGIALGLSRSRNPDRTSTAFSLDGQNVLGSRYALGLSTARNSDGYRDSAAFGQPFEGLDGRSAFGAEVVRDDRVEPIYVGGEVVAEYRHLSRSARLSAGLSAGLTDGWVQRWWAGLSLTEDRFMPMAGLPGPGTLPPEESLATPWVRYELIEDRFDRRSNRSLMGRPEFFATGLQAHAQLGWMCPRSGSGGAQGLAFDVSVSRGFEPLPGHELQTSLQVRGRYRAGAAERGLVALRLQYAVPQSARWLFSASASLDALHRPQWPDLLYLGGDNGLRGYPLRYQVGTRRALLTVEERYFTDAYLWRLFRVGAAVFADTGRAWGGAIAHTRDPGWLGDVGFGIRFVNTRAAFSNVLHVDLAFPINPQTGIRRVQFLVKTKASF